jgi:tetratricopeptide (TPR) repeat protein
LAFDRDNTLKKGEKFLRQGRLDAAIGEYSRVVEEQPRDWNTANLLGDLYFRAGQIDPALGQYNRIADHLMREGFYPKAAALYKKILKIRPDDESTQLLLAEISTKQGLLADAKAYLTAVGTRRRARGDRDGVADIAIRLGSLDPTDFEARLEAARTLEEMGQAGDAALRFRAVYDDLQEEDRTSEALDALRHAVRLNPQDRDGRAVLARATVASGDVLAARDYLDRDTAGDDPVLLAALVELDLRSGRVEAARALMTELLTGDRELRHRLLATGWAICDTDPDAAYACIDTVTDSAIAASDFAEAAAQLQEFASRRAGHIPTLLKLIEVCVDGGLEGAMYQAQVQLTDAYLENGQPVEARVIAEDLVAREPWERPHIERFRRALVMLNVEDPDAHIADRLSGQTPFMTNDPFVDLSDDEPLTAARESAVPAAPPVVQEKAQEAARPSVKGTRRQTTKPALAPMEEIDLTNALGDLDGASTREPAQAPANPNQENAARADLPGDIEEVFEGLRARVETGAESDDADFAAQYLKLAGTYIEMGMLEDAISSLTTAARSPTHRFEAAAMLGRLYMDRSQTALAIEWLEHAAEEPPPTPQEGRGLLYDLGVMLDGSGENARALAVFLELQADAGDYRDVPARIDRLARVQSGG